MVCESCLEGKIRLSAGCGEAVSTVCGGCLEGCHDGVKRLSGVCGDATWGGGRLSGGCGEAVRCRKAVFRIC